ncbi:MAG TPA: Wzz/FepE/Etk N-terminal domain-containing protein [Gemmatimonadaceae bacterium]
MTTAKIPIDDFRNVYPAAAAQKSDVSVIAFVSILLRSRRLILACAILFGLVVAAVTALLPPKYTSTASFTAQADRPQSGIAGMAAQFGVSLPGTEMSQSPAFYVDLVTSHTILGAIMDSSYTAEGSERTGKRVSLAAALGVNEPDSALRRDETIRQLRKRISTGFSQRTGVVFVSTTTKSPVLAKQITSNIVSELDKYNLQTRQSQAASERRFTERRLAEVKQDLQDAEARSMDFLEHNRTSNSPQLTFESERLQRDLSFRQQVYATVAQAYEQAKIEEVRDTPLINIVERAEVPVRPDPKGFVRKVVLGLALGAIFGTLLGFGRHALERDPRDPYAVAELATLKEQAMADLRKPWRIFTPSRSG